MNEQKLKAPIQEAEGAAGPVPLLAPSLAGEGQIPPGEQLLDPKGVGLRLIMSPRTVSDMANAGRLPAYRIGVYLRFRWVEIEQHIMATCRVTSEGRGE